MNSSKAPPRPVLSVLVLNHNYGRFLRECLNSIVSQSFRDFELIVIDDASTDDSLSVLSEFTADSRVRLCAHQENRGFVASLVEGTNELSTGDFLMVISADDLVLEGDAFAAQVALLRENSSCVAAITAFSKFGPGSERENRALFHGDRIVPAESFALRLLTDREFTLLHSGTMIRSTSYRLAGGYRTDLTNYLDLAMWLSLSHLGSVAYIDRVLFGYRIHGSQFSGSGKRRRAVLREGMAVLTSEVEAWQVSGLKVSRHEVLRARVADLALADAFAGRRVRGLQRCFDAALLHPYASITSPGWWLAGARAVLGTRAWSLLSGFRRRFR